jgi:1-acyl-sn-glycerol-3-phosphate acyltransferase
VLNSIGNQLRFLFRAIWFAAELLLFFVAFFGVLVRHAGRPPQAIRSRWLQWCSRRTLQVFSVQTDYTGAPPQAGLLVCNHLSYLDILVLVSLTPAVFISKAEVKSWPVFGWFARLAGTLFVDRTRRGDVSRMNALIENSLAAGNVVVLFPEGTSWNGSEVLPFKSSLLEPVVGTHHPINVGFLQYSVPAGDAAHDVCYWGEATFFPHLVNLMTKTHVQARVRFAPISTPAPERKALAQQLYAAVVRLRN